MIALVINTFLYIITFLYYYRKQGLCIMSFLWAYYSLFAIFGILVVHFGVYKEAFGYDVDKYGLPITPYLLNYISMLFLTYPLRKVTDCNIEIDSLVIPKYLDTIINYFLLAVACLSLLNLMTLRFYHGLSLGERHDMIVGYGEGYGIRDISNTLGFLFAQVDKLYQIAYPFLLIYLIHAMVYRRFSLGSLSLKYLISVGPLLSIYYVHGNRSGLFFLIINLSFFALLFSKYISQQMRKQLTFFFALLLVVITIFALNVSESRYGDSQNGTFFSIIRYFGEVFPNLGAQYWEKVQHFTYGARQFGDYLLVLTGTKFDVDAGLSNKFYFWSSFTGVDTALFKTLFGDLYLEFDVWGAIVFIVVFGTIINFYFSKRNLTMATLPLFFTYFCFCTNMLLDLPLMYMSFRYLQVIIGMLILSYFVNKFT